MLLQPMCSFAVVAALGLRRVGDELRLSGLTEEDAMLDGWGCHRSRIRLFCDSGGLEGVARAARAGCWGVATVLDRASAFDRNVVVGKA